MLPVFNPTTAAFSLILSYGGTQDLDMLLPEWRYWHGAAAVDAVVLESRPLPRSPR